VKDSNRILLPVYGIDDAVALLPLARALAAGWPAHISLLGIICVPQEESLSLGAMPAQDLRCQLAQLAGSEALVEMLAVKVCYDPWPEIAGCVQESSYNLLMLPWQEDGYVFGRDLYEVLRDPPCDIGIIRVAPSETHSVLLPIRGGPHAELALRISLALAESYGAEITALHAAPSAPSPATDAPFVNLLPTLQELPAVTRLVTLRRQTAAAILTEAARHDIVVMGAAARPKPGAEALGAITQRIFQEAPGTVIAVKTCREAIFPEPVTEQATLNGDGPDVSSLVDKWFAENTFNCREFEDLDALMELKRAQGVTISLGLPALNEERTVGTVIETVKRALMDRCPLLDEIVLIDSNSADRTRAIGYEQGLPVYIHQEILPQHGAYRGKGEALWKSLYVLHGDIVAWIDTDIINIDPRFVYGIVGPLLREEHVQFVKGFYRRPLQVGGQLQAGGGGRVTELVARPMLNLFYPELSGLVQPLAGEYAGRRAVLERLPFFTGYGVETGLLIDLLNMFGLQAIAQCDLDERIHKNQDLAALGKMSFQIMQVFLSRLEKRHGSALAEDHKIMKLVQHEWDRLYLDPQEIEEHERPPMIEIPEYCQARQQFHG
jgi:glycosyltransferase involved in cell wall biosynthesis/nucleotide-binding universal stress UspA family protein